MGLITSEQTRTGRMGIRSKGRAHQSLRTCGEGARRVLRRNPSSNTASSTLQWLRNPFHISDTTRRVCRKHLPSSRESEVLASTTDTTSLRTCFQKIIGGNAKQVVGQTPRAGKSRCLSTKNKRTQKNKKKKTNNNNDNNNNNSRFARHRRQSGGKISDQAEAARRNA